MLVSSPWNVVGIALGNLSLKGWHRDAVDNRSVAHVSSIDWVYVKLHVMAVAESMHQVSQFYYTSKPS